MRSYEGVFIFAPEAAPEARKSQISDLEGLFKKFGGKITQKVEWGKRAIGYLVRKHKEGYFLVVDFQMDTQKVAEFRKALELLEGVMKYTITVKNPKLQTKPAAKTTETAKASSSKTTPKASSEAAAATSSS